MLNKYSKNSVKVGSITDMIWGTFFDSFQIKNGKNILKQSWITIKIPAFWTSKKALPKVYFLTFLT